jgi:hypothetical protein
LKAYFKNSEIGGRDGFLGYYQKNIQGIIGMPFRTNVTMNLQIKFDHNSIDVLRIQETLTYTCMANLGNIQENICYLQGITLQLITKDGQPPQGVELIDTIDQATISH